MIFNIFKAASFLNATWLVVLWLVIGPVYLIYAFVKDLYYFIKILCDYKEDDIAAEIKIVEDKIRERIHFKNWN